MISITIDEVAQMSFKIIDRDLGFSAAMIKINQLDKSEGTIGVHDDADGYVDHNGKAKTGGFVANQMEFGGSSPKFKDGRPIKWGPRPFLRDTFDQNNRLWGRRLLDAGREAIGGKPVVASLQKVSNKFAQSVRVKLIRGPWQPNSIRTKRFKRAGLPPLIETGRLRRNIKAKVRVTF